MTFNIKHAERLSRGELLLRTFFGAIYIILPHAFLLLFVGLWGSILGFISWWMILFTGRYPQSFFEFQVGLIRWQTRLNARMMNLADGYPSFGINGTDDATEVNIPYPESLSRGTLLLKTFFGFFYVLPAWFCPCIFKYWGTVCAVYWLVQYFIYRQFTKRDSRFYNRILPLEHKGQLIFSSIHDRHVSPVFIRLI